jgi:hypothetical protein
MRPEEEGVRKHPGWDYMTSDSPSAYLVESEIAMLGRLGSGPTRRARVLGRTFAAAMLLALTAPMVIVFWRIFL